MTPEELAAEFPLTPDSLPQPGVPQGRIEPFQHANSEVFPGTVRDCWIYIPAQYVAEQPACVMVVQDGAEHLKHERRWHIPTVLDNLIHRGEIPVTIGIFLNPGMIPAAVEGGAPRNNRSFEYDSPGDRYARFLLQEILPEVGRRYALRTDGNSRSIMGGSSGAFCAFNVAWERPNEFRRVISIVGSYTALRGGHTLPPLVRLTEPKPLRVFLQSGANDLRVFAGDWWTANLEMRSALEYAGYEAAHIWAEHAGHDEFHGSMIFPDAVRWAWAGYPGPISAGANSRQPLARFLVNGAGWKEVPGNYGSAGPMATDAQGRAIWVGAIDGGVYRLGPDGRVDKLFQAGRGAGVIAGAADGTIYVALTEKQQLIAFDETGEMTVELEGQSVMGLAVAKNGDLYFTARGSPAVHIRARDRAPLAVATGMVAPVAVGIAADQSQLIVSDMSAAAAAAFTITADGALINEASYFRLVIGEGQRGGSGAGRLAVSRAGWCVMLTRMGIQLLDRNGLVAGILSSPSSRGLLGIAVGGEAGDQLYVSDGLRVYQRPIRPEESLWS